MSKTAITSPELAPPVGPFSQAVKIDGFLFFSGQVAQEPDTGKVVEGHIVPETERVLQNLSAVLKAASKSFGDVVRAGVFLTSMNDFAAMNGIYAKLFFTLVLANTSADRNDQCIAGFRGRWKRSRRSWPASGVRARNCRPQPASAGMGLEGEGRDSREELE